MLVKFLSSPATVTERLALGLPKHSHNPDSNAKSKLETWETHWKQLNDKQQGSEIVDPR